MKTQTITRKLLTAMLFAMGMITLQACSDDGAFEEAGEEIDNAASEAGEQLEDAGDAVGDSVEEACEEVSGENC